MATNGINSTAQPTDINYGRTYADNEKGAGILGPQSAMLTGKVALVTGSGKSSPAKSPRSHL